MQVTYTGRSFKEAFEFFGDLCRNDLQAMPVVFYWGMRNIDDERNILLCFSSLPLIYCCLPVPDHYWKKEACSEFSHIFPACVSFTYIRCAQRIEGNAFGKPRTIKTKYKIGLKSTTRKQDPILLGTHYIASLECAIELKTPPRHCSKVSQ